MAGSVQIGVIGLGYVGLPLALAIANQFPETMGFDISESKVDKINNGIDPTDEGLDELLKKTFLKTSSNIEDLQDCNFYIIGVPTPVDEDHRPDLRALKSACALVGSILGRGDIVVFESTVYPGLTEDICGPLLAQASGLKQGVDFKLGYSPERINPGDKEHTVEKITKVVSAEDDEALDIVTSVYSKVIVAGIHRAPCIKVAEAAKVIENTQRDLNISLMNELSMIFDRMQINTNDVLEAAGTKWNFLKFTPGLVGGHCIGVDPYYLTAKAEQQGYHPQVILAGRRINDGMGVFIAQKLIKLMVTEEIQVKGARVGVLGITFKENVSDVRNSRVPDIIQELKEFGIEILVHDPYAEADEVYREYGIELKDWKDLTALDGLIYAVPHASYLEMDTKKLVSGIKTRGVLVDVKSTLVKVSLPDQISYWSL